MTTHKRLSSLMPIPSGNAINPRKFTLEFTLTARCAAASLTMALCLVASALCLAACARSAPAAEHPLAIPIVSVPIAAVVNATKPTPFTSEAEKAADQITGDFIREHVAKLSDDALEGRGPGTKGDQAARNYLIEQLKGLGLQPGSGGNWEQPFDIVGMTSNMPKRWTFKHAGKELALAHHDQYIGATGVQAAKTTVNNAEVVFVGYGIEAPEYQWDDFKGQDVKGKVLLMLNNDPDWDPALFAGTTRLYYGRWD